MQSVHEDEITGLSDGIERHIFYLCINNSFHCNFLEINFGIFIALQLLALVLIYLLNLHAFKYAINFQTFFYFFHFFPHKNYGTTQKQYKEGPSGHIYKKNKKEQSPK